MSSKEHKKSSTSTLHNQFGQAGDKFQESTSQTTEMLDHPSYEILQQQLTDAEIKVTDAENKAADYWERLLRLQAEMANRERRAKLDVENAHKYGIEKFALELLPVIDNLERAVDIHTEVEPTIKSLLDGITLTLKMFHSALEKFGVEVVDPVKKPFNPELHQAVSVKEDGKVKPGTVVQVLQKGYLLNKRLIRPALVIVTK